MELHNGFDRVLISKEQIQTRVHELGAQISKDYAGKTPVLIGVLRGCILFLSDLMQNITIDCKLDFLCPSSYQGHKSTGVVRLLLDLREPIEGEDVIIVEDIVDTGLTMTYLLSNLQTRRPKSLKVCTLLDKPTRRLKEVPIEYTGFQVPDDFVVGYGLDFNEVYRNVPYIGILDKSLIKG